MEPSNDLNFLAEASPRRLGLIHCADEDAEDDDLTEYLESTIRTMRYRTWIRWYHGAFSSANSSTRLLSHHFASILIHIVLSYARDSPPDTTTWIVLGTGSALWLITCLTISQISHFCLLAIVMTYYFIIASCFTYVVAPQFLSFSHLVAFVYTGAQTLVSLAAIGMNFLALPIAKWYILKSNIILRTWSAKIVATGRSNSSGARKITIVACPFECWKSDHKWRKLLWRCWKFIRFQAWGGGASVSSGLLPKNIIFHEHLCCEYGSIYEGQVDQQKRPHGIGVWAHYDDPYGERLNGCWEFGHPIAPFSSRLNIYGSGFTALRLGWCQFDFTSKDSVAQVYRNDQRIRRTDEALCASNFQFGLLDVECSIFGKFFRKFPKFIYWKYPATFVHDRSDESPGDLTTRFSSRAPPQLGLNNRLSSFSWMEKEVMITGGKRKSTGIFSKEIAPTKRVETDDTTSSEFAVDDDLYEEDDDDEDLLIRMSSGTSKYIKLGVSWVIDRMLPYHIPVTPAEEREAKSVTIVMDRHGKIQPERWVKVDEDCAEDERKLTITVNEERQGVKLQDQWTYELGSRRAARDSYSFNIHGWQLGWKGDLEAAVFIHGYKTKLDEAPLLLGQLLALGGFPNSIKPFMFLWPAGTEIWHYYRARRASHHYLCQRALIMFLKNLINNGVRNIHILAHSMGSRLFMNSLKYAAREGLFCENFEKNTSGATGNRLDLLNMVFLHPEHYLDDFLLGGGYEQLSKYASQITVYAHAKDEALASAELLSRGRKCMGKHPFGYVRLRKPETKRVNIIDQLFEDEMSPGAQSTRCSSGRSPHDDWPASCPRSFTRQKATTAAARNYSSSSKSEVEWLDLDVIDCTYLDANVHGLKHCFFNINASVIGDLRELLTHRNRACDRHNTLEQRHGNVYTFRTPPRDMDSIFGV